MDNRILMVFVGAFTLLVAFMLGNQVAAGEYKLILGWIAVILAIFYFAKLYRYSCVIVLFVAMTGLSFDSPVGRMVSSHLALGLFCMTAGYELFRQAPNHQVVKTWKGGTAFYLFAIFVLSVMYLYQVASPVNPYEFNSKQTFKALIEFVGPFLILIFWCIKSDAYVFRIGPMRPILMMFYYLLLAHIAFRIYLMSVGALQFGADDSGGGDASSSYHLFGGFTASPFILRSLGPAATAIAVFIAMSPESKNDRNLQYQPTNLLMGLPPWFVSTRMMAWSIVIMGMMGAVLSGGRAAVIVAILACVLSAIYYRKYLLVLISVVSLILLIVVVNIAPSTLDKLPPAIGRTLGIVDFGNASRSSKSIKGSSNWRERLAILAYDEWVSDTDIFIRGRGVYSFSQSDIYAMDTLDVDEEKLISSLRTGNAHVWWLVLALKFGLISIILWYSMHLYLCFKGGAISWRLRGKGVPPLFVACIFILSLAFMQSLVSTGRVGVFSLLALLAASRHLDERLDTYSVSTDNCNM